VEADAKGMIPYGRFAEAAADVQHWKKQAQEATARIAEISPQLQELDTLKRERTAWQEEKVFITTFGSADPEAMDVARTLFQRLPAEGRPDSLGTWLGEIKADPTKAPRALGPYLPSASPAPAPAPGAAPAPAPAPNPTGRAPGTQATVVTAEQLRAARDQAMKTNDWKAFHELSARVDAEKTRR